MKSFFHWASLAVAAFALSVIVSTSIHHHAYAQAAGDGPPVPVIVDKLHDVARAPLPSPVDDPGGFAGVVRDSWKEGAYLPVVLLLLYGGLLVAKKYVPWLRVGRRAAATAAVLLALSTAIAALSSGAVPTAAGLLSALGAGLALYLRTELASDTLTLQPVGGV